MTIEQIQQDIDSGKSTRIYTSAHSCWWTHLDDDVIESRETGEKSRDLSHKDFMKRKDIPKAEKERMDGLFKIANKNPLMPLDPSGSTLYQNDETKDWFKAALSNESHYGRHGFQAFLLSHHQNCDNKCLNGWEDYNKLLD